MQEYAQRQQLHIVEQFTDVETAKQAGRTHFGRMLAFLESHPDVKIILVDRTREKARLPLFYPDLQSQCSSRAELTITLEVMVKKSAQGSGQPSVFSEITDDDIDNLFND